MKIIVTLQEVPKWPYAKTPKITTAELKPGMRMYNQDGWMILSVDYQTGTEGEQAHAKADPEGRWLNWTLGPQELQAGHEYLVRTRDGTQKYAREHRMSFLEKNGLGELIFNARPFAGTQAFRSTSIIETMDLGRSAGRSDPDHKRYMNKIIR